MKMAYAGEHPKRRSGFRFCLRVASNCFGKTSAAKVVIALLQLAHLRIGVVTQVLRYDILRDCGIVAAKSSNNL